MLKRVQVLMEEELVEKVDFYAKKMCMSRSALCKYLVAQGVFAYDNSIGVLQNMAEEIIKDKVEGKEA